MLLALLNPRIHQVVNQVVGGVVAGDASVVAEIWDAKEEMWEEMENYLLEMGKGAWSGVMEYVSVGFHAILLFRLWFQTLNNVVMEAGKASSHHPETKNI